MLAEIIPAGHSEPRRTRGEESLFTSLGALDFRGRISRLTPKGAVFQMIAEYLFRRTRLAGNFSESQEKRFGQPSAIHRVNADGLFLGRALQDPCVHILNPQR